MRRISQSQFLTSKYLIFAKWPWNMVLISLSGVSTLPEPSDIYQCVWASGLGINNEERGEKNSFSRFELGQWIRGTEIRGVDLE